MVEALLGVSREGMSKAQVEQQRGIHGWNELPVKERSLILLFLRQFQDVMVWILLGALALTLVMPMLSDGQSALEDYFDAAVITAIILLNAILGFVQEYKAEQAIAELKKLTAPRTRVRRGGHEQVIPSRELVPGDIVILEAGDKIAADGRILTLSHFEVNESSLTGESQPVTKVTSVLPDGQPLQDQRNMVFAGTIVSRGSAECVITTIGLGTQIGHIAKLVAETAPPATPLEQRMRRLSMTLGVAVLGLCAFVVLVGVLYRMPFFVILLTSASLAVSAVPEGLPAVVTVSLALGVRRMTRQSALVRRLDALETLGSVTVICADKTGTITENRMEVRETWTDGGGGTDGGVALLALIGASCNRAQLPDVGDPTEVGLLRYAELQHTKRLPIDEEDVPFSAEEKYMQTRHTSIALNAGGSVSFLKGAPERIVELCDAVNREEVLARNRDLARRGLRVLACAVREQKTTRFVGLIALEDPPREGVREAIAQARQAGIRTLMITGDNIETARAIAREVGIEEQAIEGHELDRLSPGDLEERVRTVSVFARVSPVHKMNILEALKANGHIVAMSGDGVNDAPALKSAHVGVAMGKVGTEVSREAASIVLADDHYATIVSAVREGRRIYDNIRKFVLFLLRSNFDELLFITMTLVLNMPLPYLPIHILWINLMTDSLPALALGLEPAERDIMRRPPRPPREHLLAGETGRLVLAALWAFGVAFLFFLWQLSQGIPLAEARTATFTLAIIFELFLVFTLRSKRPLWEIGLTSNPWLLGAVAVPFALQILLLTTPLREFFHLTPLSLREWGMVLLLSASGFVLFEFLKLLDKGQRESPKDPLPA